MTSIRTFLRRDTVRSVDGQLNNNLHQCSGPTSIVSRVHIHSGCDNNLCLAPLGFRHIRSSLLPDELCKRPRVGDVCVAFLPVTCSAPEFGVVVDLYNSNVANSGAMKAMRLINTYAGTDEKQVSCMPVQTLVSEWNRSLDRFNDAIRCQDNRRIAESSYRERSKHLCETLADKAYRDLPVKSDNLWSAIHTIVNKPCLVKEVLQLVGSVASVHDDNCLTGTVQGTTIERPADVRSSVRLYLTAKPAIHKPGYSSLVPEHAGVQLSLIWTSSEDELFDHLRNAGGCYYILLGTEYGNDFKCSTVCDWRYFDYKAYGIMHAYANDPLSYAYQDVPSTESEY